MRTTLRQAGAREAGNQPDCSPMLQVMIPAPPLKSNRPRTTPASARRRSRRWRRGGGPPPRAAPPTRRSTLRRRVVRRQRRRRCCACTTPGSGSGRRGGRSAGRCGRSPSPASSSVFGSPSARPGRKRWNHVRNSAGGSTRRIRSASIRLGEKKSVAVRLPRRRDSRRPCRSRSRLRSSISSRSGWLSTARA